jgi:hypothetical protein
VTTPLPLSDAPLLRRVSLRTRAIRIALVAAVAACAVAVALVSRHPATTSHPYLPSQSNGIVVLDLSASISTDSYQQIGDALSLLAKSGGRYGLVLFSGTAYEALPPGTPARELRSLVRFFQVDQGQDGFGTTFPTNPWTNSFSYGTSISSGLDLALDLIRREQLEHPSILLVSDLNDDPGDLRRVSSAALAIRRAKVPVRVVALSAQESDEKLFARLFGSDGAIKSAPPPHTQPSAVHASFPFVLVLLALLVAGLLAASVFFFPVLRFSEPA